MLEKVQGKGNTHLSLMEIQNGTAPVHPLLIGVQNGTPCTSIADGSTKWYNPCGNQCGASSKSLKTDQL